jgi:nitroreductase
VTESFFDVARRQRACRDFDPAPVPDADITRMLEAAIRAPSAENHQPWVFVVLRDAAVREQIAAITARAYEGFVRDHTERTLSGPLLADVRRGMGEGGFARAPLIIVVGADTERTPELLAPSSIFPAVQNLLLAAGALGYGSALTTLTAFFADELRAITGLPGTVTPMAAVYVGRPARSLGPSRRRPVSEVAHADRFGVAWDGG